MVLTLLQLKDVRSILAAELQPSPGFNLLVGDNGAGKTSVLEALHLLAHGKSFRGRVGDGLVRSGADALEVFARWQTAGRQRQVGLRHSGQAWSGRLDGADCDRLSELCTALAVTTFEPGSHALLEGRSEHRRRWLDWGLFHVEPVFLGVWQRMSRAHRQRNALLKQRATSAQLDAWEHELADSGEWITHSRTAYLEHITPTLLRWTERLLPDLGALDLTFQPGWRREHLSLADALFLARERDLASGFTSVGPHRADWEAVLAARAKGEALSRGQTKLLALALLLGQAEDLAQRNGCWPVVLLDDLASELDPARRAAVLSVLADTGAQVFITGTEADALVFPVGSAPCVFHVEHGRVTG